MTNFFNNGDETLCERCEHDFGSKEDDIGADEEVRTNFSILCSLQK